MRTNVFQAAALGIFAAWAFQYTIVAAGYITLTILLLDYIFGRD